MRNLFISVIAFCVLCACMPETRVRTLEEKPMLAFMNSADKDIVYVDGNDMGYAENYDADPDALVVLPGSHFIEVKDRDGRTIYSGRIFVESHLKTITLR